VKLGKKKIRDNLFTPLAGEEKESVVGSVIEFRNADRKRSLMKVNSTHSDAGMNRARKMTTYLITASIKRKRDQAFCRDLIFFACYVSTIQA
jgi:hypothetical protein